MKLKILFILLLFCSTTTLLGVNPTTHKVEQLSKKAHRKYERQQKIINFSEELMSRVPKSLLHKVNLFTTNPNCDTLFLNNGTQLLVKIVESDDDEIIYKKCAANNAKEITLSTSAVQKIGYTSSKNNSNIQRVASRKGKNKDVNSRSNDIAALSSNRARIVGGALGLFLGLLGLFIALVAFKDEPKSIRKIIIRNAFLYSIINLILVAGLIFLQLLSY